MRKVAIIKCYEKEYDDYSSIIPQSISEWIEISDVDFAHLETAIKYNLGSAKDYTVYKIVEFPKQLDTIQEKIKLGKQFNEELEKRREKERQAREKNRERRQKKSIEDKKKLYEKLKQELEGAKSEKKSKKV